MSYDSASLRLARRALKLGVAGVALLGLCTSALADTLAQSHERGSVLCGVNPDLPGFSHANSLGEYSGFDVDYCRAVSAAIFGDPDQVSFVPIPAPERFEGLNDGRYDILSRNTTWTLERNVDFGTFAGVSFYDGQGFMVPRTTGIRSALELDNQPICVSRGTTTESNTQDFFTESELRYKPVYFEDETIAALAYADGKCSALTTDRSALAAQRAGFEVPDAHLILPEVISKEPLGPVVRHNDIVWENVARWTLACLINAEELGVDSDNVSKLRSPDSPPAVRRLLGVEGDSGDKLGLDARWCDNVISMVGNYQQIYDRNVGPDTPVGLERGVNTLWTNSGLLYAPPIQ